MKITTILGSPRKKGNTATVLRMVEELFVPQHEVERITLPRIAVNGCRGCEACQRRENEPECIQHDIITEILAIILDSDLIVYASPVYVWDFSAQMKALIDRHCCFVKWKRRETIHALLEGKPTALLTTCGGSAEENADLIREIFLREMQYLRCHVLGTYAVPYCTLPSRLGDIAEQTAQRMAAEIAGNLTQ